MDLLNELQYHFGTKGVLEGTTQKDAATERYQPTLLQRALGVSGEQLEQAGDIRQQRDLQKQYGGQLAIYGGKKVGVGENENSVLARLQQRKQDYDADNRKKIRQEAFNDPNAVHQRNFSAQQYADGRQDIANQMELTRLGFQEEREARRDARADALEQRADELALRREEMEREDMRYNENIARMDRKDRQQSIQTLVAGLANLGAAFAL